MKPDDTATAAATAAQLVATTAQLTDERITKALTASLRDVFGESDTSRDPGEMKILIRRIPIICSQIDSIHANIKEIKDNTQWITRLVLGAVILAVLGVVIKVV